MLQTTRRSIHIQDSILLHHAAPVSQSKRTKTISKKPVDSNCGCLTEVTIFLCVLSLQVRPVPTLRCPVRPAGPHVCLSDPRALAGREEKRKNTGDSSRCHVCTYERSKIKLTWPWALDGIASRSRACPLDSIGYGGGSIGTVSFSVSPSSIRPPRNVTCERMRRTPSLLAPSHPQISSALGTSVLSLPPLVIDPVLPPRALRVVASLSFSPAHVYPPSPPYTRRVFSLPDTETWPALATLSQSLRTIVVSARSRSRSRSRRRATFSRARSRSSRRSWARWEWASAARRALLVAVPLFGSVVWLEA